MTARLTRSAVAAVGAAALLATGAVLAPASAAPGGWQPAGSSFQTFAGWTSLGHVAGFPGNAHSGDISIDTDEGGPLIDTFDWTCPAGVTPPTVLDDTPCTLLRERFFSPQGDVEPVFTGAVASHFSGSFEVEASYPGTDRPPATWTNSVYVAYVRTGPITETVQTGDGLRTVTRSAPMLLTGHVGPTRFADPTVSSSVSPYVRTFYYSR